MTSQCRSCGTYLTPVSTCTVCKEDISWVCQRCDLIEDVTHAHPIPVMAVQKPGDKITNKANL